MRITVEPFGTLPDGRQAQLYILENNSGMRAEITNFGGVVHRLLVPDKDGKTADVVLGHPDLATYVNNPGYFGALVGRNCNRIADAQITIGGKIYALDKNNGKNNLHGGNNGLSFQLMAAEARTVGNQPVLLLTHTLEDMSDGFPGNLTVTVAYTLTDDNSLTIDYRGISDADTAINLTNHSYFNLAGGGDVLGHTLQLSAPFYSPGAPDGMPTGELKSVEGSPFDFRSPKPIGRDIASDCDQVKQYGGYDHNLALSGQGYRLVGTLAEPKSGRVMEISTNLPAVQLYTANMVAQNCPGKNGAVYNPHSAVCLETQFFPNAVNFPWLISPIFRAGEEYVTTTGYRFSTL